MLIQYKFHGNYVNVFENLKMLISSLLQIFGLVIYETVVHKVILWYSHNDKLIFRCEHYIHIIIFNYCQVSTKCINEDYSVSMSAWVLTIMLPFQLGQNFIIVRGYSRLYYIIHALVIILLKKE